MKKRDMLEPDRLEAVTAIIMASRTLSAQRKEEVLRLLEGQADIRKRAEVDPETWQPASRVAELLEVSLPTVLRWVKLGKVDAQRIGERVCLVYLPSAKAQKASRHHRPSRAL